MKAMSVAIVPEALAASAAASRTAAEALAPALAVLAGLAGAWLQAVHPPPASARERDAALVALSVV